MTVIIALLALGADPAMPGTATQVATSISTSNGNLISSTRLPTTTNHVGESANFVIRSHASGPDAMEFKIHCERVRSELQSALFDSGDPPQWRPKCEIVLHRTRAQYLGAVGAAGSQTSGSAAVGLSKGLVTRRRIDLLVSADTDTFSAVKHELVHVLFADQFPTKAPPKWAEEGLALISDSDDKQNRHRADFRHAKQTRTTISFETLLCCAHYPPGCQRPAFYGQSHAIVEYLVRRDSPKRFVEFVQLAMDTNPNSALKTVYGLEGASDLAERLRAE